MTAKIKASIKLYLLVGIQSVFMIGIGIYGIIELRAMNENTQTLYADRMVPMSQLGKIRFFYMSIPSIVQQTKDRQITFSDATKKLQQSEDSIRVNWAAYLLTYLTPQEKQLVQQTESLISQSLQTVKSLKAMLRTEHTRALNRSINSELDVEINRVVFNLTKLSNLQVKVSGDISKKSKENYHIALRKFFLLAVICLLFAIPFSFYLARNVKDLITDLSESNKKIKQAEEKWRAFIKYAGDSIALLDQDYRITEVNNSACALLGYSREEMMKMDMLDIVTIEERESFIKRVAMIKKQGASLHERKWKKKDGSTVETEVNVRVLENIGYIAIIRDITERKKAEALLKLQKEKLIEIAFLQSHIVRRPIANVLGLISLINFNNPNESDNLEVIPKLEIAAEELDAIIHEIVQNTKEVESIAND